VLCSVRTKEALLQKCYKAGRSGARGLVAALKVHDAGVACEEREAVVVPGTEQHVIDLRRKG